MRDRLESLPMPDVPVSDPAQIVPHFASVGALFAVIAGWLPYFVAIIPAIYYCILIYESKTVQGLIERRRQRRLVKEAAKLKAKALVLNAQVKAGEKVADAKVEASTMVNEAAVDAQVLLATTAVNEQTKSK